MVILKQPPKQPTKQPNNWVRPQWQRLWWWGSPLCPTINSLHWLSLHTEDRLTCFRLTRKQCKIKYFAWRKSIDCHKHSGLTIRDSSYWPKAGTFSVEWRLMRSVWTCFAWMAIFALHTRETLNHTCACAHAILLLSTKTKLSEHLHFWISACLALR